MADKARVHWNPFSRRKGGPDATSTTAEGDAGYFLKWFLRNRYALMESFLPQLVHTPSEGDRGILKGRFLRATRHAQKVLGIRLAVTVLLVLATGSAIATTVLRSLDAVPGARELVERVAAVAASLTLLLIALRFAVDRYLERVTLYATFVGMQIAGARDAAPPVAAQEPPPGGAS